MIKERRLFLLDGNALVYRAHYAFIGRPLVNSQGLNTSAITGFVRSLWDILTNQKPTHIAVSFDISAKTFRNDLYPEYKANREAQPEDITLAMPYIIQIIEAFHIPILALEEYEADDIIGTVAKKAVKNGFTVYLVTPDKDFAQLVSDGIYMYKPSRQGNGVEILGIEEVLQQWDIDRIDQVVDKLGLQGDSVDNIPGIPGIGPKTASKLLETYGSLENVLAHSHELKGKQKEQVEQHTDQAILSKKLATINTETPIDFSFDDFKLTSFDREKLATLFKELEFRTLGTAILGESTPEEHVQIDLFGERVRKPIKPVSPPAAHSMAEWNISNTGHHYTTITSENDLRHLISELNSVHAFCVDTETTGLDANIAGLVGLAFSVEPGKAYFVPVPESYEEAKKFVGPFKSVLENEEIIKIGQNLKFDALVLRWYGIELKGLYQDTMIAHYLLEPEKNHNLDYLAERYLQYETIPTEKLLGKKGRFQLNMRQVPLDKVAEYACEDADITLQLSNKLFEDLEAQNFSKLYFNIEEPIIKVLTEMEYQGIRIDPGYLKQYSIELERDIMDQERAIYKKAGVHFNIASPKQVGEILFEKMQIPYRWRKTKTGQYSTDEDKMNELALEHEIVSDILRHRMFSKLKSTYVDALPLMINRKTGRVHSSFNQALTATGRLSSNNPNLQNIPIRTEEGRRVREAFIPRDDDHVLLSADYSQVELRLIAAISGDENLLDAFHKGQDIHRATAARVYDVSYDEVTPEQRRNAKTVNFSITYGAGATNLSRQLSIKRSEASALINQYFRQYRGLKNYMHKSVSFARENGFVETLMGRRRYLRDINSRNGIARSSAERIAINTPIQGSAAEMIKLAMIDIHKEIHRQKVRSKLILQVHDELLFDVHKSELDVMKAIVEEKMKTALPELKVPVVVGMGIGKNWLEAH